ncbi:MAG: hypothetical protein A2W61_00965 [Deltaproteobacteria bacterium RIFCSPLOWO2_01_44_7]|nr:MAG: hypothetical protein A2712_03095 [Deltaproteobacteria bacterium RIFCSPHIGHO2_01_FULL_43_49]OGQ16181.1 MAG: hypothetical protein A3D22_01065 [Deltaproteobacteria bacterium RIFCSPHIGHO2_02_FULL_44_53]OGQ29142.1 MAG: hypothetical protein A3D98_04850 [Deltaproteobacteria bacterium RIFCSPHIGHO2_12_FULL_44_21]OGQ32698.1 MAG: hypothetical protein A2979_08995 [Deltaproteobacteria bacterium RIFCSPLOWO2_01_FULL_45_74]OGQ38005.1 MAG: hypothetical protein A2W61_00965 [Deltaproteobacteria bacterium 
MSSNTCKSIDTLLERHLFTASGVTFERGGAHPDLADGLDTYTLTKKKKTATPLNALEILYYEKIQQRCPQFRQFRDFQKAVALFWMERAETAWKLFRENVGAIEDKKKKGRYFDQNRKGVVDLIRSARVYLEGLSLNNEGEKRIVFLKGIEEIVGD